MSSDIADSTVPLFSIRAFRLLFTTRVCSNTGNQMQAVIVGLYIYQITGSALALGMIGLVQFMPPLLLTLVAGQVADRYDRRLVIRFCYVIECSVTATLLVLTLTESPPVELIFALLLLNALARTFEVPSLTSLTQITVPRAILSRAVALHSSAGRISQLVGPSLGGLIYAAGGTVAFAAVLTLTLTALTCALGVAAVPRPSTRPQVTWRSVLGGLLFIWSCPPMLGAMSLDLMATLFGGAVSILPMIAHDILHVGPWGVGILRSAPAVGGLCSAAFLSRYPLRHSAGLVMFGGFTAYGVMTLLFGLSSSFLLSIGLLLLVGMFDTLTGVIRQSIIQLGTPDEYRGRVMAVHSLCVGTAGQLGGFESGVTAAWFGAQGSILFGGAAVFVIVALWAFLFPQLRAIERPEQLQPAEAAA